MASKNNPDNRVKSDVPKRQWLMIMPGRKMVYFENGCYWDKNGNEVK